MIFTIVTIHAFIFLIESTVLNSLMCQISEKDAFSMVVSAFRAQGMLNDYKRVLLEHLKAALLYVSIFNPF